MNDLEPKEAYPSTAGLAKQGVAAVGYAAGGIFLLVLQGIARFRVLGLIIGAAVCVIGIASLLSKDPEDKKPGAVITGAGVLTVLSKTGIPLFKTLAGTLLGIGAVALLAMGVLNGIRFFRNLKKRS